MTSPLDGLRQVSVPARNSLLPALRERDGRIEYLEAENAALREALALDKAEARTAQLMQHYTITPAQARLLWAIAKRGMVARETAVLSYSGASPDPPEDKTIAMQLHRLRKAIRPHGISIVTVYGLGFRMSAADQAAVLAVAEGGHG